MKTFPKVILSIVLAQMATAQLFGYTPGPESDTASVAIDAEPAALPNSQAGQKDPKKWSMDIYPILAWLPIFGASVNVPALPAGPGGSGEGSSFPGGSGTASSSFNGAAFVGLSFRYDKWMADFTGLWAGLSAERTLPNASISAQVAFGDLLVGRQIYRHIALTGGFRHLGLRVTADVGDSRERTWKPDVWDPLIGLTWRDQFSSKWSAQVSVDGGGFGVGSDVDISARAHADWKFARHFGLMMGYGVLHFQNTDNVLGRPYGTKQTLNGPMFGFGIYL